MDIYFVRHGETCENANKNYYGDLDISLNELGKEQMRKVKEKLKNVTFNKVYTSERVRTIESANIILSDKYQLINDKRINEMSFGVFEGKSYTQLKELYPQEVIKWQEDWINYTPQNGENYKMFYQRVKAFMKDIEKLEADNILVVAHSGVIRAMYSYIMDENLNAFWKFGSKNGDITLIKYEYKNYYIDSIIHVT